MDLVEKGRKEYVAVDEKSTATFAKGKQLSAEAESFLRKTYGAHISRR